MLLFAFIILFVTLLTEEVNSCSNGAYYSDAHCVLTPEEIEGPFYIPYHLLRKDIREGKPGLKLELKFMIRDENCESLVNVTADVWHCDELGYYSSYTKYNPDKSDDDNHMGNVSHAEPTDNTTFMRGIQISDNNGVVEFVTNFPGWYYERTIHIHIEVFKSGKNVHTGQIYFTVSLTEKVVQLKPYSEHKFRRYHNEDDKHFMNEFGNETIIMPQSIDKNIFESGLKAEMFLIVKS